MGSSAFFTWNPALSFEVPYGALDPEELQKRTLSFRLTDNARQYDTIEWTLDNADGYLTDPRRIAAGLIISVRVGYHNAQQPWRSFIINMMSGGIGVKAHGDRGGGGIPGSPVGDGEAQITLHGTNRNAPNVKKGKRNPYTRKRTKGGPTSSITNFDLVINRKEKQTRIFKVSQTSDAVWEMAKQAGYDDQFIDIEPTGDTIDTVVVQSLESYGHWLMAAATRLGFQYKADANGFRFIRERSPRQLKQSIWTFDYGADDDCLRLSFNTDFRLPVPRNISTTGYDPDIRTTTKDYTDGSDVAVGNVAEEVYAGAKGFLKHGRSNLTRDEYFLQPGGSKTIKPATIGRFIRRHLRSFKVRLTLVGNPKIMAAKLIDLRGTGSFLDRRWYVGQAVHEFDGQTYTTELGLEPTPKQPASGDVVRTTVSDDGTRGKGAKETGKHAEEHKVGVKTYLANRDPMKRYIQQQARDAQPGGRSQQ